jgi:hypothetical protein
MTNPASDPSDEVLIPLDRTLDSLATRGIAWFAVGLLALVVSVASTEGVIHEVSHLSLPALLVAVVIWRLVATRRGGHGEFESEGAWTRARELRRRNTELAAVITGAVPIMWLVGGASILLRHAHDVADLAIIVGIWIPIGAFLWGAAAHSWLTDARECVARALRDSERRFRAYWQNIGRVA